MTLPARRRPLHLILAAVTIVCAALLVLSAIRTYQELNGQRAVFLRSRVAALAAHLETLPPSVPEADWQKLLTDEEEALTGLAVLDRPSSPEILAPLWDGRELFRTERIGGPAPIFRAYVPFHSGAGLRIARIDIAESAADFLVEHARHHLWFVAFGGLLIVGLTVLTVRNAERAALAERRQLELQHLATLGEMSASLAHEIRNPLGTIKGFAQLLEEKLNGAHAALLTPILSESSRLENLVKDLLLYGRPALPAFASAASSQVEAIVGQHAQHLIDAPHLRFASTAQPFSFDTDLQLLEQILLNLLRNAIDAVRAQPAGLIQFEISATAECAVLRIADNGPGLSEEARRRLFEPFYTSKATGTGLGLSISRKLVESLGGHLSLDTGASGGLTAEIRLPLHRHV